MGAPGCGKGSMADRIEKEYGYPKVSTGGLLRDAVRNGTPLGLEAASQLGKGKLVEDRIVLALLRERLEKEDCRAGYTLDGFPRNLSQAVSLKEMDGRRPEAVFDIAVDEETIVKRILSRLTCGRCDAIYNSVAKPPKNDMICDVCGGPVIRRKDDDPVVIKERMRTYHEQTEPLIAYYDKGGSLHRIDGNGTVDETYAPIRKVLDRMLGGERGRGAGR